MDKVDHEALFVAFEAMDRVAPGLRRLSIAGEAALLMLGRPARRTTDVHVESSHCLAIDAELRAILAPGGLVADPADPGPAGDGSRSSHLGGRDMAVAPDDARAAWDQGPVLWQGNRLTVVCPPPAVLAAARLIRASEADVDDIVYLVSAMGVSRADILRAAKGFAEDDRQVVRENASLLAILAPMVEQRARARKTTAAPPRPDRRGQWVTGVHLLRAYLRDDLVLARAIRERRWSDLLDVAQLATGPIDNDLAVTDPFLYRALRQSVTQYHLRGYGCLDVALLAREVARGGAAPAAQADRDR